MKPLHKILMVATTFVLAAATGHVMQNPARFGLHEVPAGTSDVAQRFEVDNLQQVANIDPPPAGAAMEESLAQLPALPDLHVPADVTAPDAVPQDIGSGTGGFAQTCAAPELTLSAAPAASVQLTLNAPCDAGATVSIRHEGLTLPITLSDRGLWTGVVPVLAAQAHFAVELPDGNRLEADQPVSDLSGVNRVALSWQGDAPLALHGFEYGASFGDLGDISASAPRTADTPLGGWMASFEGATAPVHVQVYTALIGMTDIHLQMEAAVSQSSCGTDIGAEVRRVISGKAEAPAQITLAMPDCDDAVGAVMMPLPDFPLSVATN